MKRLLLGIFAGLALAAPASMALATYVYTDSWGCDWQGGTYASGGQVYGYTAEDWPQDCSSQVAVAFSYKSNGVCYYGSWQYAGSWYIERSAVAAGAVTDHQIYVPGYGYGQVEGTYYPSEVC